MRPLYNLSPFNTLSEVTKNIHFNKNLTLCDLHVGFIRFYTKQFAT